MKRGTVGGRRCFRESYLKLDNETEEWVGALA
jgi:hypothetical protein